VRSVDFLGQPLVLFRTESGRVGAVAAHCWHMGTHLGAGRVVGEHLQCPLHCWEFDGQGICRRTPAGRPPPAAHQRSFPVVERFGGVFAFNGPRALFPPPAFDVAPERELSFGAGKPVRLRCPWYALASNGFDVQHLQTVHARQLRQPAVVERTAPHQLRLRYVSRVVGNSPSDRLVRWLSGDRVHVTITCWGGQHRPGGEPPGGDAQRLLASCAPPRRRHGIGDLGHRRRQAQAGHAPEPAARARVADPLHALPAARRQGTRGHALPSSAALPEGEPMLQFLRFLHDLPPAAGAWSQDDDRSERPATGRSAGAPRADHPAPPAPTAPCARA
jgi:nitrite reductase/ring-hydroxylating ferredoxin subunit